MTSIDRARRAAAALAALLTLGVAGCSSGSDDQAEPAPSISGSDEPDGDTGDTGAGDETVPGPEVTLSDEEQLRTLLKGYETALNRFIESSGVQADFAGVTTTAMADTVAGNFRDNVFSQDKVMVGDYLLTAQSVTVTGDQAVLSVCSDSTGVVTAAAGETVPSGTRGGSRLVCTYTAVRADGAWLFDSNESGATKC